MEQRKPVKQNAKTTTGGCLLHHSLLSMKASHTASTRDMAESIPSRMSVRKKITEKACGAPLPAKVAKVAGKVWKLKMYPALATSSSSTPEVEAKCPSSAKTANPATTLVAEFPIATIQVFATTLDSLGWCELKAIMTPTESDRPKKIWLLASTQASRDRIAPGLLAGLM